MPTFEFTSPEGKTYSVEGPDGATKEQAFAILSQSLGTPQQDKVSTAADMAKAGGVGVAKGAIGLVGMPGDIGSLVSQGVDAAGNYLGVAPETVQSAKDTFGAAARYTPVINAFARGPTSGQLQNAVEAGTGKFYEPQTGAGRYAQSVGEFVPAMLGGPESLATKFATRALVPGIASEAAGQLTGDNPYAKIAAGLIAGAGASAAAQKFQQAAAARGASTALTADDVLSTASKQFDAARDMNVVVKPGFATQAAADMRAAIKDYDPNVVKGVHDAANRLETLAKPPTSPITQAQRLQAEMNWEALPAPPQLRPVPMNETENIRKQLVSLKTSPDATVRSAAREAIKSLQKSQMALTPENTLSGDASAYRSLISDAVGNWAKGKQANTVLGKISNAELNSATAGSGANQDNNMRQSMKQLARNVNNTNTPVWKKLGFSDEAGAAINQAARGTVTGNIARGIGKGAPTGVVSAAGGLGIGHMAGGPVGAVALPAVGYIAKKIGDLSTKRAANAITSLVLSESPLAAQVAARLPQNVVQQMPSNAQLTLQRLILADPLLSKSAQQQRDPVGQANAY